MQYTKALIILLTIPHLLGAALPKNMEIAHHFMEIDGCAKLRDLVFTQARIHGHIDAHNCEFTALDASGFLRLINSRVTESVICRGELALRESLCAKVAATAKLIVLENAHIDELIVEQLVLKGKRPQTPKIILKGNSSIGRVIFAKMAGTVILKSPESQIGALTNGTVLRQSPEDQK